MALDLSTLTNPYGQELAGIERNRALASALMQSGSQQPQGQMISGRYVAPSFAQNLNPLLQTAVGLYGQTRADTQQSELAKTMQAKQAQLLRAFAEAKTPAEKFAIGTNPYAHPLLQSATYERLKPQKVGADESIVEYDLGGAGYSPVFTGPSKLPAGLDVAASLIPNLPKNRADWTEAQRQQVENKLMQLEAAKASVTHVNLPSEGERKAGFMANILDQNMAQMQRAYKLDPTSVKPNVPASIVEAISGPNVLSRAMTPAQRQIVEDSQLDVLDAALTLRTGAAYTREQLKGMKDTYFPRALDPKPVIEAKKQRLESLLNGAYIASGRATPKRVSEIPEVPTNIEPNLQQQLNVPAVSKPRFLGFEQKSTGQ